ncbi:MAG: DUF2267 domain-containing protein [Phycisphaeraceae bacterium]
MTVATASQLERSVHLTNTWLDRLEELGGFEDHDRSYAVLKAGLQTLRDRLVPDEAIDLAAQLPVTIRGMFYEGWKPSQTPEKLREPSEMLAAFEKNLGRGDDVEPKTALRAVFQLLDERVTEGEVKDVRHMLNQDIANELWPRES